MPHLRRRRTTLTVAALLLLALLASPPAPAGPASASRYQVEEVRACDLPARLALLDAQGGQVVAIVPSTAFQTGPELWCGCGPTDSCSTAPGWHLHSVKLVWKKR